MSYAYLEIFIRDNVIASFLLLSHTHTHTHTHHTFGAAATATVYGTVSHRLCAIT